MNASLFVLRACVRACVHALRVWVPAWARGFVGARVCVRECLALMSVNSLLPRVKIKCVRIQRSHLRWRKRLPVHYNAVLVVIMILVGDVKGCRYALSGSLGRVIQVPNVPVNTADNFEYHGPAW